MKKKEKKKKPAPSLGLLKRKAWKLLSEWVRRKDADEGGTTNCFTCGAYLHWKYDAQAGHAIGGRRNAVLLDAEIIRPQCFACNAKHIGNGRPEVFIPKLIRERGMGLESGMEWWEEKAAGARKAVKLTRDDLEKIIETYKQKLEELPA